MIKKVLSSIFVAVFMSTLLVGCGGSKQADKSSEPKEKKQSPMGRRLQEGLGGQQQQETPAPATESQEQPAP
ncbi:MAG: hypothetical protein IT367_08625 [Candidatus Hydrogenedentes bacterium]|nr:hypothetical protein [Candidatus Hydrogenedentota bacterium]